MDPRRSPAPSPSRALLARALLALTALAPSAQAGIVDWFAGLRDAVRHQVRVVRLAAQPPDTVLHHPLRGGRVARIRDTWGAPRGADRRHEGQDLFAARGTPVHSVTGGYVFRAGENRLGGLTVWVMGAGRRLYYYAHLDGFREGLEAGQFVDTGTVLGYVGATGNAAGTPPHLHLGMYGLSGALDPLPLLRDRPR